MDQEIEPYAWSINLNHQFTEKLNPFVMPRLKQAFEFIGLSIRYYKYHRECKKQGIQPHMDFFTPISIRQGYGAPIGGIGAGTIGRTFTGEFGRYQLVPGLYEHETVDPNLFTVCIRKNAKTVYQQALCTKRSKMKGLKAWNMAYSGEHATYYALYPESWTVYNLPGQHVTLTCHQLTPVIPHNYKDSSLPVGLFNWNIANNNDQDIELSLMFTWQAGSATDKFQLTNVESKSFDEPTIGGVSIKQKLKGMPLEYVIAAKKSDNCEITHNCQFYADDEQSGKQVWLDLLENGKLGNNEFNPSKVGKSQKLTIAVCVKVLVKAKTSEQIDLSLVWHMPTVNFHENKRSYHKFYTKYFPASDPKSGLAIASYALSERQRLIAELRAFQQPILSNPTLPKWFVRALFNELYYIADGGTVWFDMTGDPVAAKHKIVAEYGRFAYLEGHEYRMYNTYDVHFNASFALLQLWPKLQLSLQYEFADTIDGESDKKIKYLIDGKMGVQKAANSLPHDIGDPYREPWLTLNAYNSHDTADWKDLNLKFILTCYRDYYHLKDLDYLKYMWPYIKRVMITVQAQDHDGDGLIDSTGIPDQTYDAWSVMGASAYCGGLHVSSLQVVCEIAKLLEDQETLQTYDAIMTRAKKAYNDKLWNGKYYKYDCSNSSYNDSIMSDMCCGHWYLRSSGLGHEAFDKDKVKSCLETIFEFNVMKYGDGKIGSVNGMRPNGKVDITSMQSEEMWVGVTDSIAALMIYEDMSKEAWTTLEGMYNHLYNELGLAFQTPEAIMKNKVYRSLGYMRALCIWSVYYSINDKHQEQQEKVGTDL